MKKLLLCFTSAVILCAPHVSAHHGHGTNYKPYAKVIKVAPVYYKTHHTLVERCYPSKSSYHNRHYSRYNSHYYNKHNDKVVSTVTGAVVGGVIGHALGQNSSNRKYIIAAGTVIGGVIGNKAASFSSGHQHQHNKSYHCKQTYKAPHYKYAKPHKKLKGYNVVYKYKGNKFHTFTKQHPGKYLRIH